MQHINTDLGQDWLLRHCASSKAGLSDANLLPTNLPYSKRLPVLLKTTGLSRASAYSRMNPRPPCWDPAFPRPISLSLNGKGAVAFHSTELFNWFSRVLLQFSNTTTLLKARKK